MEQLERELRDKIIKVLWLLVWGCIALDVSFFVVFFFTDGLGTTVSRYVFKYLCLPFFVNMLTYLIARRLNSLETLSDKSKNMVCAVALCTIGGSMGIFHSYYTPLWCAPCMALLLCSVFHSRKINGVLLVYSCVLVVLATIYGAFEIPSRTSIYVQNCVVVLGITFLSNIVAIAVQNYQKDVEILLRTTAENEKDYRRRLERDLLTEVHSREYMQEFAAKTFEVSGANNVIGMAVLDLDDFKHINDEYGHDNGDKVLHALGELLQKYSNEYMEAGRFGGEEFVIIFQGEAGQCYEEKLEEIRKEFSGLSFDFMKEKVSFSAGLVECNSAISYEKAFTLADQALYTSKIRGKNRVTVKRI